MSESRTSHRNGRRTIEKPAGKAFLIGRFQRSSEPYSVFALITISLHISMLTAILLVVLANRTYRDIRGPPGSFRGAARCSDEFCVTAFYGLPYARYANGVFGIQWDPPENPWGFSLKLRPEKLCPDVMDSKCLSMNVFLPSDVFTAIKLYHLNPLSEEPNWNYEKFVPLVVIARSISRKGPKSLRLENMYRLAGRLKAVVALVAYRDGAPGFLRVSDPAESCAALGDLKTAVRFLTDNHMMFGIHREKVAIVGGGDAGALAAMNLLGHRENDSAVAAYIIQGGSPFSPEITRSSGDSNANLQKILKAYFALDLGPTNATTEFSTADDVEQICDFDPNPANYPDYKECFERLDFTKLSMILDSLENDIPLLPRLGAAEPLRDGRQRVLLGLSKTPPERFSSFPDVGTALSEISNFSKAHNQPLIVEENLMAIYGTLPDGPTILHDFLIVCPMYELAKFLRDDVGLRVYFYVFVNKYNARVPAIMSADQFAFIHEAENFEIKRVQVNFQFLLGSFIHDAPKWLEWKPNGAHLMFDGTERIIWGFRERVCGRWKRFFEYRGIDALR